MVDYRRFVRSAALVAAGVVMLAFTRSAAAQAQRVARIVVAGAQTCGGCRVQRTTVVDIKDTEHLAIANEASLLVDRRGQVYVQDFQTKHFLMFDPRGKWLGTVGGVGAGPGEFKSTISAKVDLLDSLWVADPNQRRISIFAPGTRAHVRDVRQQVQVGLTGGDWLLLDRGQLIVSVPFALQPEDRLMQIGADGRVVKKLGPDVEMRLQSATLAPARDGKHFWRARVTGTSYVIEKWTNAGALVQTVERVAKWWAQPSDGASPTQRPGGGDIHVESVREDADGKLWTIMRLPHQKYWENRARTQKVQEQSLAELQKLPRAQPFYRLLDVIDPGAGKLVYSDSLASRYVVVAPDIAFCGSREDGDGFRMLNFCRLAVGKD